VIKILAKNYRADLKVLHLAWNAWCIIGLDWSGCGGVVGMDCVCLGL
jgi:hypothetical protein